jgi:hypothetical protein
MNNPSIHTAYRIVERYPKDGPSIFMPQYQEEGSKEWHNFTVLINGRGFGYNTIYFYTKEKALDFLHQQKTTQDTVVHYECLQDPCSGVMPFVE